MYEKTDDGYIPQIVFVALYYLRRSIYMCGIDVFNKNFGYIAVRLQRNTKERACTEFDPNL